MNNPDIKFYAIYLTLMLGVLVILNISPIAQDPEYHNFADQRQMVAIPHFWNVISNLPFLIISYFAVSHLLNDQGMQYPQSLFSCYLIFFIAIGTVGLGSAYYHWHPTNETLFWDRLPMTVGFMAFISIIIGEFISEKLALKIMYPLIILGTVSVIYWYVTEQMGRGDLRLYGLIQFLPMLIIPMILLMFPARYTESVYFWAMLGAYLVAKIFELFDAEIYSVIGLGGHAIKHFCAAIGAYLFYLQLKQRRLLVESA